MQPVPDTFIGDGYLLRRWEPADAPALQRAISESAEHLKPWLGFMQKPQTLELQRAKIHGWVQAWGQGGDAEYALVVDGELAGGVSLLRRRGPGVLEVGYWIHSGYLRRGLATDTTRTLTRAALQHPAIAAVEIHHDKANLASEAIPRRLGFRLIGERPVPPRAPLETGTDRVWSTSRSEWAEATP